MPPPRKPEAKFVGHHGFAALPPSSLDPVQIAQFALENLGSSFPSADQLRATKGQELRTLDGIKQRISAVKAQQEEEMKRVYSFRNLEAQDLLLQQWLGQELDSVPKSTMVVNPIQRTEKQPHDETFLTTLANQRRLHEHATDDLVDRVRFSHLQTLAALRQKQAAAEKVQQVHSANAFPRTVQEFNAITDPNHKLRVARFLVNPQHLTSQNNAALHQWTAADTDPLVQLVKVDPIFRASVSKIIDDSTSRDPRLRR
ncbi:hypothetical protein AURDEDRAFT_144160 [Auricularia subglabra TFB-10046 SS5]|nr:hypothetical protein AURDEDRAFT_144160 [Auricularia subglabra TFB-10046 SS5]